MDEMNGKAIPVKDTGVSYRINWIIKSLGGLDGFNKVG